MLHLELPYPPSINHYFRHLGSKVVISRRGRAFRVRVWWLLRTMRVRPMTGELAVVVDVFPPDRRRRDIDNVQKALLDALQHGGLYEDDSQIVKLDIERRGCVSRGRTIVRIQEARRA